MFHKTFSKFCLDESVLGGLMLIACSGLVLWLTSDLSQGSLAAMGAGFLPRWLALAIGGLGILLVVSVLRGKYQAFGRVNGRGLCLVLVAIIGFALMIKPFSVGSVVFPGLGIVIAGPFVIIVSGFATPEARLAELVPLSLVLTAFCMLLFGDLLNLPIPIFPQGFSQIFPGVSTKLLLRLVAALLIVGSAIVARFERLSRRESKDASARGVENHS